MQVKVAFSAYSERKNNTHIKVVGNKKMRLDKENVTKGRQQQFYIENIMLIGIFIGRYDFLYCFNSIILER